MRPVRRACPQVDADQERRDHGEAERMDPETEHLFRLGELFHGQSIGDRTGRAHPENEYAMVNANEDRPDTTIGIALAWTAASSVVTTVESRAIR